MKICILGNVELAYSSETYYIKTLLEMGHKVFALQEGTATGEAILDTALKCDLFVWIHGHSDETPGQGMAEVLKELKDKGVVTMTWHHDLFFGLGRQNLIEESPVYKYVDHFFTTDKLMANWVNENTHVRGHYLPSAVYGGEAVLYPKESDLDVIFVGNRGYHSEWPYRPQLIDWLTEEYGKKFGWYSGEEDSLGLKREAELNQVFADSKIVVGDSLCLNFDYPWYWSDRVWETLGRGGFLIMPYVQGMDEYFEDGKHLVFYEYGDFKDLKSKIDFYLSNSEAREYIRRQGHELVKNNHSYKQRWEYILDEVMPS